MALQFSRRVVAVHGRSFAPSVREIQLPHPLPQSLPLPHVRAAAVAGSAALPVRPRAGVWQCIRQVLHVLQGAQKTELRPNSYTEIWPKFDIFRVPTRATKATVSST